MKQLIEVQAHELSKGDKVYCKRSNTCFTINYIDTKWDKEEIITSVYDERKIKRIEPKEAINYIRAFGLRDKVYIMIDTKDIEIIDFDGSTLNKIQ